VNVCLRGNPQEAWQDDHREKEDGGPAGANGSADAEDLPGEPAEKRAEVSRNPARIPG